ncbi:MAG: S8 family serine peptidase [Candidatus Aminicenantes bacterium]|nr:S8 family serine peptidase [Candidatus Aminicenantes bacterium]
MKRKTAFWPVLFVFLILAWVPIDQTDVDQYVIRTGIVSKTPLAGEKILPQGTGRHLVVQFYRIPDSDARRKLAEQGIQLLSYLDGNAYIASVTADGDRAVNVSPEVRAVISFEAEMKLSPLLKESLQNRNDATIPVVVVFHEDVPFERALRNISDTGLICSQADFHYFQSIDLEVTPFILGHLLQTDEVRWIDPALTPPKADNAWAAERAGVDEVWNNPSYDFPRGRKERIGIWDEGKVQSHGDLKGRVNRMETAEPFSEHATHVAGTITGSGKGNTKARGMTTAARIYSYDFYNEVVDEMRIAVDRFQIKVANHSWSNIVGWNYSEETEKWEWWGNQFFGYYHNAVKSQDRLVRNADLLVVRSAGNDRDEAYLGSHEYAVSGDMEEDLRPPDPEYGSVTPYACGKNVITVGALMKDDVMTGFSNWGPTDDGRIKPDVVATGKSLLSTIRQKAYESISGTSMSAPVVSGTAALLRNVYSTFTGDDMGAALLKCLLIHSARDLGNSGPDYSYGFGLIDARYAADVIKAKNGAKSIGTDPSRLVDRSIMIQAQVSNGNKKSYKFNVPAGSKELRATLVWHDPEDRLLINNLDLWLKSPSGQRGNPYTLNPAKPAQLAVRKINDLDNVEHILTRNPDQGKWTVFISGKNVPQGPQKFALIVSTGDGNAETETKSEGKVFLRKVYAHSNAAFDREEQKQYVHGESIYFKTSFALPENADWDTFYGTVSILWKVLHKGRTIFKTNTAASSLSAIPNEQSWIFRIGPYAIPTSMERGDYVLKVQLRLHNGMTRNGSYTFKVI